MWCTYLLFKLEIDSARMVERVDPMFVNTLMLETTRKCNLSCIHCMRGDAENLSLRSIHMDNVLGKISRIGCLYPTGGEPALAPDVLLRLADILELYEIEVESFQMVTNGTICSSGLIHALERLLDLCMNKNEFDVFVSSDRYHPPESSYSEELMRLPYVWKRDYCGLVFNQGRALRNGIGDTDVEFDSFRSVPPDRIDGCVYMNALGYIIDNPDLSYEEQKKHIVCHSSDFSYDMIRRFEEERKTRRETK